ncbi:hypothetical protein C0993_008277 [Termitomyces sp. T159_Od127]|nr:hypothetical protein C0993_008277 [Termitomyces sp. T159_Od127]
MTSQGALAEVVTAEPLSRQIANMVLQAMQPQLAALLQAQNNRIEAILTWLLQLEQAAQEPQEARQAQQLLHVPRINPPEVYDGKSKQLADQFAQQVEVAAEFECFQDNHQKIVWAQSYLTGLVRQWSAVITTGMDDPDVNLWRFCLEAWLVDFKAAFCTRDQAQDALTRIGQLQQGSRSITDYCTAFFELKGKLGHIDAESKYIKDRFWKGLNMAAMEALVNTDYQTAEEAHDILLHCESKLADLAVRRKRHWHASSLATASSSASASNTVACSAPSLPLADPNAMDVDHARGSLTAQKCYKCGKTGHLVAQCPTWVESIQAVVCEVVGVDGKAGAVGGKMVEQPGPGFV